jgi:hypothetical protein
MATIPSEASSHLQLQGWASVALPRSSNLLDPRAARFRVGVIDWSNAARVRQANHFIGAAVHFDGHPHGTRRGHS